MTTSTKRPDGGELKARKWDGYGCPDCKGTGENLANPMNAGLCQTCSGTGSHTPTNKSPAPQAEASEHAPWSEDEEDAERLLACASRRKKYGDENCECDEDGSCVECEYDMQDALKKRYAPPKHTIAPAPQPPVEGLREALKEAIDVFEGMNDDEINEELLPRLKAALFDFTPAHLPTGREHDLKTWPEFFEEVIAGRKTFEVRHNDRDYKVGDILWLREWSVTTGEYSGRETRRLVTYVMSGRYGVEKDTIIMALASPSLTAGPGEQEWTDDPPALKLKPEPTEAEARALSNFIDASRDLWLGDPDGVDGRVLTKREVQVIVSFLRRPKRTPAPATLIEQSGQKETPLAKRDRA